MTPLPSELRAGRYVRQPTGYRAFVPAALPPDPPIQISGKMQALLSRANWELGRLDGSMQALPHADLFARMYVRKEAVLSSQIEGTQSSLNDVLVAEAKILIPARPPPDVAEVINYVRAMNHGLGRLPELPLSIRLLKEAHAELLQGVCGSNLTPGEIRRSQNWIGPSGCTLTEALYVPPHCEDLADHLGQLERFFHEPDDMSALIKIGLAHVQFETIHPFLDGNGRVGRLLITFYLCAQGILSQPVLCLSHFFKAHQQAYYAHLQAVRERGDWEEWLRFFLQGVIAVSAQGTDTVRRLVNLRETHRLAVTDRLGRAAGHGHRVLEKLFARPIMSVTDVMKFLDVTFPAANALVAKFEALGILQEITGHRRNRVFRYDPYVDLFRWKPSRSE